MSSYEDRIERIDDILLEDDEEKFFKKLEKLLEDEDKDKAKMLEDEDETLKSLGGAKKNKTKRTKRTKRTNISKRKKKNM